MPIRETFAPEQLIRLSLKDRRMEIQLAVVPSAVAINSTPHNEERVAIVGSRSSWTVRQTKLLAARRGGAPVRYTMLNRYDFDAKDDEIADAVLMDDGTSFSIEGDSLYSKSAFQQNQRGVRAIFREESPRKPREVIFTAQAGSLAELRAQHPTEFRAYVMPLLAKFSDESLLLPGAADVYTAFSDIPASANAVDALRQLLPDLDADDPTQRDSASVRLAQLGAPGVLAALRLDESGLSDEQKVRVRVFVAAYRHERSMQPAGALEAPGFLIDCLEYPDPAVRAAAKARLQQQIGRPIAFDPSQVGEIAAKATDALRIQLLVPAVSPSTHPAPGS
ncbi:MAG TPA: hypothetical protein VFC78_02910 [Tepidisphaeraceae bacterium]|nr:hypothetical protein [Tepidisphaeraceae bacterium]